MDKDKRRLVQIHTAYETVKAQCARGWDSPRASEAICNLAVMSLRFLESDCKQVRLVSKVPGKQYIGYLKRRAGSIISRPANEDMFLCHPQQVGDAWRNWSAGKAQKVLWTKMSYTVALAPCLAMEIFDRQNKKGPATYFECLIGHIFAKTLGVNPTKRASLIVDDHKVQLTMDFLFEKPNGVCVHLPVKMSTRERVVQAWAHQRILDGAFGAGAYKGVMVLFSETKLDSRSHEVVEICVPDQWLIYQTLLSRIERIYYFDIPSRYGLLTEEHPDVIQIRQFGEFFTERAELLGV